MKCHVDLFHSSEATVCRRSDNLSGIPTVSPHVKEFFIAAISLIRSFMYNSMNKLRNVFRKFKLTMTQKNSISAHQVWLESHDLHSECR